MTSPNPRKQGWVQRFIKYDFTKSKKTRMGTEIHKI